MPRPLLVIVSGRPGSGKSTLARRLADALWLPSLSCDAVRNGLAEAHAAAGERFEQPGLAGIVAFYAAVERLLESGASLVAELSFRRGLDEERLRALAERARIVDVHCRVEIELAVRRFVAREPERRATVLRAYGPGHPLVALRSADAISEQMASGRFDWTPFDPLDLDLPRLMVDTTDGYRPDLDQILAFIRRAGSGSPRS